MGRSGTPQADREDRHLSLEGDFVLALGPPDDALAAHAQIDGEQPLPRPAVGDACEPDKVISRHALIAGDALEFSSIAASGSFGCQPGIGWPAFWVSAHTGHPPALEVASHRRALPRQDRHQRDARVVGGHGRILPYGRPTLLAAD